MLIFFLKKLVVDDFPAHSTADEPFLVQLDDPLRPGWVRGIQVVLAAFHSYLLQGYALIAGPFRQYEVAGIPLHVWVDDDLIAGLKIWLHAEAFHAQHEGVKPCGAMGGYPLISIARLKKINGLAKAAGLYVANHR